MMEKQTKTAAKTAMLNLKLLIALLSFYLFFDLDSQNGGFIAHSGVIEGIEGSTITKVITCFHLPNSTVL